MRTPSRITLALPIASAAFCALARNAPATPLPETIGTVQRAVPIASLFGLILRDVTPAYGKLTLTGAAALFLDRTGSPAAGAATAPTPPMSRTGTRPGAAWATDRASVWSITIRTTPPTMAGGRDGAEIANRARLPWLSPSGLRLMRPIRPAIEPASITHSEASRRPCHLKNLVLGGSDMRAGGGCRIGRRALVGRKRRITWLRGQTCPGSATSPPSAPTTLCRALPSGPAEALVWNDSR